MLNYVKHELKLAKQMLKLKFTKQSLNLTKHKGKVEL